jgi:transglycosylase-like protein with SLT domain
MRRLTTSTLLFVAFLNAQPSLADSESGKPVVSASPAESTVAETSAAPAPASTEAAMTPPPIESEQQKSALQLSRDDICQMIESAANGEALPFEFLARLIWQESKFNPQAVSPAGAQGIAQFMPSTARGLGLDDPFDAAQAIDAQAHLMRDLLRRFAAVPLALAAYNAGPAPVAACMCVPPYPETRGYVARILGLLGGAGEIAGGGLEVRLVE